MTLWKDNWEKNLKAVEDVNWNMAPEEKDILNTVCKRYPMSIPEYYYNLIDQNDLDDPIKKMCFPNSFESSLIGESDTSGESTNTKMPGLQHKYKTTALVLTTNACFMYCRHCFRKRMVGYNSDEISNRMQETVSYLKMHTEVNNVLLTGGDSFCMSNEQIENYLKNLVEIDHLDFIRFGTRALVVFPERIYGDSELVNILEKYNDKKKIIVITQFNHPRELTSDAKKAIDILLKKGITINNQAVILKGVNDDSQVLADLLNGLTRFGVNPYYVFQCRPVKAVKSGFQKTLLESHELITEARLQLNGISKRFRLIMSHVKGKIEIVGVKDDKMIFKFHQAKNIENENRIFIRDIDETGKWLDDELNFIK